MNALVLVDIQNDFMPGGALGVKNGDQILPVIKQLLTKNFDLIVASKDWHPKDHISFASRHKRQPGDTIPWHNKTQILWPDHCVQGTKGADFAPGWDTTKIQKTFLKGTEKDIDSYSTFFDNEQQRSTGLETYLKEKGIQNLYIAGLTTEYCVTYSVRDARQLGFNAYVVLDGCRGVDLKKGDVDKALHEMRTLGAHLIQLSDLTF